MTGGARLQVARDDGSFYDAVSVATFNDGYSHIIADDGCWLLVNGHAVDDSRRESGFVCHVSPWIFGEAWEVMQALGRPRKGP